MKLLAYAIKFANFRIHNNNNDSNNNNNSNNITNDRATVPERKKQKWIKRKVLKRLYNLII